MKGKATEAEAAAPLAAIARLVRELDQMQHANVVLHWHRRMNEEPPPPAARAVLAALDCLVRAGNSLCLTLEAASTLNNFGVGIVAAPFSRGMPTKAPEVLAHLAVVHKAAEALAAALLAPFPEAAAVATELDERCRMVLADMRSTGDAAEPVGAQGA